MWEDRKNQRDKFSMSSYEEYIEAIKPWADEYGRVASGVGNKTQGFSAGVIFIFDGKRTYDSEIDTAIPAST